MKKVKIITDSCSDLTPEMLSEFDIDYAKMSTVLDGIESPAYLTWTEGDAHELYETIRNGKRITTTQVSVEEFRLIFEKYLKMGMDIVYIGCSSKQSGSVNTGRITANKLLESYPDSKIHCIDSLNASMGEGLLAIEAAKLAASDKGADEIFDYIMSIRKKVNQFVTVHTLDHLKKAGRVSASAAFFGNLMGVKPILISDINGTQTALKKVKGRKTSFAEIVSLLKEAVCDQKSPTVYLAHADCPKNEISELVELIETEMETKDIKIGYIGPIIGASIGPDAVGIWALGKDITFVAAQL
ncbi:MAG: DegV family protein [Ruminococcaceae bacterium]|nr:DegV family protein [Oscillospiraceae bacterium]